MKTKNGALTRTLVVAALVCVTAAGCSLFFTVAQEVRIRFHDTQGQVTSIGTWFMCGRNSPDAGKLYGDAMHALDAKLVDLGFERRLSWPFTDMEPDPGMVGDKNNTLFYVRMVGRDLMGIWIYERGGPITGAEVWMVYDVSGYKWSVARRVRAIRSIGSEIEQWGSAYDAQQREFFHYEY